MDMATLLSPGRIKGWQTPVTVCPPNLNSPPCVLGDGGPALDKDKGTCPVIRAKPAPCRPPKVASETPDSSDDCSEGRACTPGWAGGSSLRPSQRHYNAPELRAGWMGEGRVQPESGVLLGHDPSVQAAPAASYVQVTGPSGWGRGSP